MRGRCPARCRRRASGFVSGETKEQLRQPAAEVEEAKSPACSVSRLTSFPRLRSIASRTTGCRAMTSSTVARVRRRPVVGSTATTEAERAAPSRRAISPEDLAAAEGDEHRLLAGLGSEDDLDQSLADHEQRVAGVALVEDVLPLAVGA